MQTVIDEVLVNYEIISPRNKNTILILHGWKRSLNDWRFIADQLGISNKVVLLDMPGFGASSLPKNAFDTYDYARFVEKFIDKLKLNNITLLGHSVGGRISIILASECMQLKKLILVDPSGVDKRSFKVKVKILINRLFKPLRSLLPSSLQTIITSFLVSDDYKTSGALLESYKKIVEQKVYNEANTIKIPTLIVWGDKDTEVPVQTAKLLKKLITSSKVRIAWNCGHNPFLEKPSKFLEIIEEFI